METRPRLKIPLTTLDKILEGAGWAALLALWVMTVGAYPKLPETIPIHYNSSGAVNGFGPKATFLFLPGIATVLFVGMTALNRVPHIFNYASSITPQNAFAQYTGATRLFRYLKLVIVVVFGHLAMETIGSAAGKTGGLGRWFLPVEIALVAIPLIVFIVRSATTKR